MNSGALSANPFVAPGMIKDPRLFVGRKEELQAIASRMSGVQPTSVNIVGKKYIGKSSLLYHFFLTWEQRVTDPSRYVVIYLSLRDANCKTEMDFYEVVAEALLNRLALWKLQLRNPLQLQPLNRQAFSDAIKKWQQQQVLPVLCLDDFEVLLQRPQQFDHNFYNSLRSLMDDSALMLAIASRKKLGTYAAEKGLTSPFFNVGQTLVLRELTTDEAIQLTRLPDNTGAPALSIDEQNYAQQWGKRHPYELQLACKCLWEARYQDKDIKWAKEQFLQEINQSQSSSNHHWLQWQWLRWIVWDFPVRLGRVAKFIGANVDDTTNWIIGFVILILLIFVVVGLVNWEQVKDLLQKSLGR
ncbi:ATP-binding protein [Fischerella sp. JS2]|uniref:ATP-binding protein n=1 Tax=Fischerella sp. JS2 TaxID=2597771 RepID=UPI0028F00A7C|nr:ATP-binding protein [Fischerella sp. JS2]